MQIKIKKSWDAITWNEYEQIEQIINADIPSDYKAVHLVAVLTGLDIETIESLPISQFQKFIPALEFLQTEPETHKHQFEYTLNGRKYVFRGKLDEITTAQYIDYRTYMQDEQKDVINLLSCFLIPEGCDYNDGNYDIEQVKSDIGDMCWLDVRAAAFFFRIQLAAYTLILKSYLKKTMKEAKATKKQIKQMEVSLDSSAYCLLSSRYANVVIPNLTK